MTHKENYADAISGLLKEQGYLGEEDESSFKNFLLYF